MKILAVSTNTKDVSPFVAEEFKRVGELAAAGIVINGWLKADFSGTVLVLDVTDKDRATEILGTLPSVANDATTFALTEIIDPDAARPGSA